MRSVIHINYINGVKNMGNEKKLILDKEINGCKVKVFCAAEKKKRTPKKRCCSIFVTALNGIPLPTPLKKLRLNALKCFTNRRKYAIIHIVSNLPVL